MSARKAWEPQSNATCSAAYTMAAPKTWSYRMPHANPLQQENAYQRYPQHLHSNYLYRQEGTFYSEPKGACVSNDQCIDGLTSSSCLYKPFYAGATCKQVSAMGYPTSTERTFADGTDAKQSAYAPWDNIKQSYDTLLANWAYKRPGYNATSLY